MNNIVTKRANEIKVGDVISINASQDIRYNKHGYKITDSVFKVDEKTVSHLGNNIVFENYETAETASVLFDEPIMVIEEADFDDYLEAISIKKPEQKNIACMTRKCPNYNPRYVDNCTYNKLAFRKGCDASTVDSIEKPEDNSDRKLLMKMRTLNDILTGLHKRAVKVLSIN